MTKRIYSLIFLGFIAQIGYTQTLDAVKLDTYFDSLEAHNLFMGSVGLFKEGKVIYTKQTGFSDLETKKRPTDETKYRIGSISKTYTATLIFKAIEDEKLALNESIKKYFPTIKKAKKITIAQLLNHSSGIHNFTDDEEYIEYNTEYKSEKEMIEIITEGGSDFKPGSKSAYSNSNYILLSYILQKIYGKTYAQILNDVIIIPLGLKNTYYGGEISLTNNECNSYSFVAHWAKHPETDMSIPVGAGAVVSAPTDLLLFKLYVVR